MNVQPTRPGPAVYAFVRGERHAPAHRQAPGPVVTSTIDQQPSAPVAPPEEAAQELAMPVKGVLDRLQEGHFKGVADVRLRINFQQELQSLQTSPSGADWSGRVSSLKEDFAMLAASTLPAAIQTGEAREAFASALSAFETAAHAAVDAAGDAESGDSVTRDQALQTAFDQLASSAQAAFMPEGMFSAQTDEAEPAQDTAEEQPYPKEIPSELAVFMSEMTRIFSEAMGKMAGLPALSDRLPALSEPEGHGSAYEKFVTEYNRQRSGATAPEYLNLQG